jgi:hypothetical protein
LGDEFRLSRRVSNCEPSHTDVIPYRDIPLDAFFRRIAMETFLAVVVLWLSANFGFAANPEYPRVEFVPPSRIISLRYKGLVGAQGQTHASADALRDTVSIYDDAQRIIYLPEGWTGRSPAELSILVHEMVHHLQNVGQLKFECPQEREKAAYEAQAQWLALFKSDLAQEFGLDGFNLLIKTKCFY